MDTRQPKDMVLFSGVHVDGRDRLCKAVRPPSQPARVSSSDTCKHAACCLSTLNPEPKPLTPKP